MGGKAFISNVNVASRRLLIAMLCIVIVGGLLVASIPEAEVNVSATAGYQGQADVAVDPNDPNTVMVVGSDDNGPGPTAWSSVDGGDTYASAALPLMFAGHTFAEGSEPAVAVDPNGTWYAAYEVHDLDGSSNPIDSSIAVARSYNGLVWEEAALVEDHRGAGADPSTETPHIAVDLQPTGCTSYSGRLQLVWVRRTGTDRAVYHSYSTDNGSTWATPVKINDGLSGSEDVRRPRVAIGPGGRVHAVWLDDLQKTIVADSSTNGGQSWGSDVNAATVTVGCGPGDCGEDLTCSGGALHGSTPALAVDTSWTASRGTLYVAFADDPPPAGDLDVFVISSADGGTNWSSPAPIGSVTDYQQYGPALAVHPVDGSLHAVWYDRAGNPDPVCETRTWHAVSIDGGATWTDETAVSSAVSDYDGDPRGEGTHVAVAAASTQVFPVWTDDRAADQEIYLGRIAHAGGTLVRGGTISTDTTWLAADGPFIVTGDQTIAAGATLTIEAGTEVRMATCDDLHSGLDAGRVEIIVEGVLDVAGTAGNTVQFQSGKPVPAKGDWYGIRFQNTAESSNSTLDHAAIRDATYGIRLSSSSPTLQDVEIDQATTGGLEGTTLSAVPFSPTRVTVTDAGTPVSLANVSGTWTDVTLQDSTGAAGTISGGSLNLRLVGMRVLNNAGGGLISNRSGGLEVILSEFSGNGSAQPGLTINGTGPRTLVANDFTANVGDGIKVDDDSSGWPAVALYASNFVANGGAAVRMMPGSLAADARRSYWGALEAEMTGYPKEVSGIWDIHDDASLRHVDFRQHQGSSVANDVDLESYLAVPSAMNDNETVIYGGAVARNGVYRVEVSTDGGSTWSDATVEGAAFSFHWVPAPGTYTVMSRVTDSLMNVEAVPDQVIVNVGTGPTLSGTLLGDETWSGGPIVLEGDVVVPAGVTLTIDPGTVVHAQYLTDSTYGGLDPSRIEIIVQGVLESNGAMGNEIVWESSRVGAGAQKGDWYGIRYLDTTTDTLSVVQHTQIGHGVNGVKLESAAPDVFDSTIHDCSQGGLSGSSGSLAKAIWVLSGNTIQDNDGDGVNVTASTQVEVLGATITGNGGRGLSIAASPNVVTVTNATVSGNGATGMWIDSGGTGFILLDSIIDSNGADGVYVNNGGTNSRMERLTVSNNANSGIFAAAGSELVLLKSVITGNQRGLRIGSPRLVAAYNSITGNTGNSMSGYPGSGVYYYAGSGAPAVLGMNDLDDAVDYEVYMTTPRALEARRNYWGAVTTADMDAAGFPANLDEFFDIHENSGYGAVDYDNWAAASVAGAAPGDLAAHITWPGDAASLNVSSVVLSGVAYAAAGIDRVEICVREQGVDPPCGDAGGNTPFGVVNGKEAWTFEWFPPSSGTFELEVRVVDTANVKSTPSETITYSVTVLGATVTGPVSISGPVIGDQTWSGDIELTGDVVVEAGHTLTLLPGTNVRARALADDRLGGEDTSRIELIVQGNLVTQGTSGSPVTLSSTSVVPEKGDWYGIRFETVSDASLNVLDWTSVEAGWQGLEFRDTFAALNEVSSSNNYANGLYLSSSTALFPATATISGGSFLDNGNDGVYLYSLDGTWTLDGVEIGNNGSDGLYVYTCNADGPFTLNGVNIHDNVSYGAYLYSCGRPVNVLSSTFDANLGTGFYANNPDQTTIRASTFSNHTNPALVVVHPAGLVMSKNTFSGNQSNASISNSVNETEIVFNEFGPWTNSSSAGLTFSGVQAATSRDVHFNNLREQGSGVSDVILRNAVAAGVNARANYWDPDTTTEMDTTSFPADITSIEDVEDNPGWGRVDYRAHLPAAVDLAPPQVCGFTNPVDGDALTGLAFTLSGAAAADDGIQVVEISTDGGSTWMPATGEELWSYVWTPPGSGNYTLQCRVTDTTAAVQAVPTSINVDVMAAAVTTSGTLSGDETWSGVIVLTGDVTVPAGITLTISEGTTIKAAPQSDDQFGGVDSSRIELIVQGSLDLQGSAALPVTFTSNRVLPAVPTAGDWYGIRLLDTADSTLAIHDAVIEAGVRGIWGYPGSHQDIQNCVVRDMTQYGMYLLFGGDTRDVADPGIDVSGNTVERTGSGYYGIYLQHYGTDPSWNDAVNVVDNNTTNDTGLYGIYFSTLNAGRTEVDNNVVSTANYGIYLYGSSSAVYTNQLEASGNQVSDASVYALYFYGGRSLLVDGNTVTGGAYGMYMYAIGEGRIVRNNWNGGLNDAIVLAGASVSNITLHRNEVTGYGGNGLVASSLASLVALYNDIGPVGGDAIRLTVTGAAARPRIHWNNIQGSGGYDASLSGSIGADVRRNYWDATNAEMIAEGYPSEISELRDIEDNDAYGRLDYRGVETSPVATAVTLESRFVWPFDGDTMSRRSITLEGTAYADAGVQMVEISTDGGATWLPATGADFWTFPFTPVSDGPQVFLCRVTDMDNNVETTPDAITVTFDSSLPTTEGTLAGDETWTGPSPIVLTGDVIVPFGTTLTIDPGTTLRAQPLADNSHGGVDLSRIELIVEGTLNLQGTALSPVTFTSDRSPTPLAGDWYGVRFTDTADHTVPVHDLVVEFGLRGISSDAGSYRDVRDCTVRDMKTDGIYLVFGNGPRDGADPGIEISGNTVERTGTNGAGIYFSRVGSDPSWNAAVHVVDGNTTSNTGSYGIYVGAGNTERIEVTNNNVSTATYGIYLYGSNNTSFTNRLEVTGNQVSGASSWALYLYAGRSLLADGNSLTGGNNGIFTYAVLDGRITRNTLVGGSGTGLNLTSNGTSAMFVHRNSVSAYGGDGLYSTGLSSLVALYNTITGVGGDAIETYTPPSTGSVPQVHWNNIDGSSGYDARLDSVIGSDMRRNYWTGTNAEMLAEGYPSEISEIYDIEDNPALGRADYRGVESTAVDTSVTLESRFIWPFDGDTLSRHSITLEGTAYADAGVQMVEISTDGGSSWTPATGADVWTFSFTPIADGPQEFWCRVTDGQSNVETTPDVLTVTFDSSLPTTEGTLPGDETWSGTVLLTGDVVVPAGRTLTIDPGTTVQVQPLADNSRGGVDLSRIELIVEGTLVAQGTGPGSIQMTSASVTPAKGQWYGIRYDGTPRTLPDLRNLSLAWVMKGISETNGVGIPDMDGISVQHAQEDGIRAASAPPGGGDWTFRNVQISLADMNGMRLDTGPVNASVVLENILIDNAGREALYLSLDPNENLTLQDSTLNTSTSYDTMSVDGPSDTLLERVAIHHSNVSGNALSMVTGHAGDLLTIDDSEITGGNRSVYLYRIAHPTIRRSRITGGVIGVYLLGYGSLSVDALLEENRISDTSSDGVYIGSLAGATLHYNDLYNIAGYTLNNQSVNDIDAADNYWGEGTETEMGAKGCSGNIGAIYDQHDNASKGLVTYCNYATVPFGDQPTIMFYDNAGQYEIHWNPKGGLTYDLIRGDLANLAVAGATVDVGDVTCDESAIGGGVIIDLSPDPPPGGGWFYLLRDHTTPGTYGRDSAGRERVPSSGDCP